MHLTLYKIVIIQVHKFIEMLNIHVFYITIITRHNQNI